MTRAFYVLVQHGPLPNGPHQGETGPATDASRRRVLGATGSARGAQVECANAKLARLG